MQVELTRYAVPSWGRGELWTTGAVVLAHDFTFEASAEASGGEAVASRAHPPMGAHGPPSGTVSGISKPKANGSVPDLHQPDLDQPGAGEHPAAPDRLIGRFSTFFRGEDVQFTDVRLDLSWATPFQRAVAETLRRVPRGEVVSYGELAALVGHPGAQRAVGTFCARNRFMVLVPCHRVIGADGIGGYGGAGVAVKRRLLALEGITL